MLGTEMDADTARLALRSLKTIATNGGVEPLSDYHRRALGAFQRHISQTDEDVERLPVISPDALAAALPDEATRRIAVHDLAFMALVDPEAVGEERFTLVEVFAEGLGVAPAIVEATGHAVRRQKMRLQLDALRMMIPKDRGLIGKLGLMWDAVAPFLGVTNADTAARYRALERAAPGTLGRAYFEFITSRGLAFPGEKGGAPEAYFVPHDLTHVLADYATDRDGEVAIIGYQAGYTRSQDPLEVLLLALVQVQLGIVLDPVAAATTGELDFDVLLAGYGRGTHATLDFTGGGWDFRADFDQPLDALRERYGVVPG